MNSRLHQMNKHITEAVQPCHQEVTKNLSLTVFTISKRKAVLWVLNTPPNSANLFMGWFKDYFIYPLILRFSKLYLRYNDDIFSI